jgi:hypothetical protein
VVEDEAVNRRKQGQATSPSVSASGSGNGHRMSLRVSRVLGVCRLWCRFTLRIHGIHGRQPGRIVRSVIDSQEWSRNLFRAWAA